MQTLTIHPADEKPSPDAVARHNALLADFDRGEPENLRWWRD